MNKRKSYKGISIGICMFFIMLAFVINGIARLRKIEDTSPAIAQRDLEVYELKLYNGRIAVFYSGENDPITVTDISEHTLRSYDKELLKEGIIASDSIELARMLEDFGS